jgi:hypothetical protein
MTAAAGRSSSLDGHRACNNTPPQPPSIVPLSSPGDASSRCYWPSRAPHVNWYGRRERNRISSNRGQQISIKWKRCPSCPTSHAACGKFCANWAGLTPSYLSLPFPPDQQVQGRKKQNRRDVPGTRTCLLLLRRQLPA